MPCFTVPLHEYNQCHVPSGPDGGQFCSTRGLKNYPRPRDSADLPDFLKDEVLLARQAGVATYHRQQPEPLMDIRGEIVDPLAYSNARRGEEVYYDKQGFKHVAPRGRIVITTRGGEFEPTEQVWSADGFPQGRRQKDLTPEMLPEKAKATVEDIESTFRHELGHIMDDQTWGGGGKIGVELAREIRAWQYAVAISPDHKVSQAMVRRGLESHAYSVFRKEALPAELTYLKHTPRWDLDVTLERIVQNELRSGVINIEAHRKAVAFTNRTMKALDNYAAVLRKKGLVRIPQASDPYFPARKVHPGPGGRGWL